MNLRRRLDAAETAAGEHAPPEDPVDVAGARERLRARLEALLRGEPLPEPPPGAVEPSTARSELEERLRQMAARRKGTPERR